jgi:hypothetical protein
MCGWVAGYASFIALLRLENYPRFINKQNVQAQTTLRKVLINLVIVVVCIIHDIVRLKNLTQIRQKEYHIKALATHTKKVNHLSNHGLWGASYEYLCYGSCAQQVPTTYGSIKALWVLQTLF